MQRPRERLDSSEKDAKLAQKLGQLQPFVPVFPQECIGQLASCWANLTPFSLCSIVDFAASLVGQLRASRVAGADPLADNPELAARVQKAEVDW